MSESVRVLFVVSTLESCGPVTMLRNVISRLDRSLIEPSVLTLSPEPESSDYDRFAALDVSVHSLGLSRSAGFVCGRRAMSGFLRENRFDVINTHGFRPDLLASGLASKVPVVSTVHNEPYLDYSMTYGRVQGWFMAKLHLRAMAGATRVVGCSEYVADCLKRRGLKADFIRVGVDTDLYRPASDDERAKLREKLGVPSDAKLLVSVGDLSVRKDPLTVIDGFLASRLRDHGTLLFLGDGPLVSDCTRRAQGIEGIRLLGRVSNVQDYLRAADCLISASRAEGLPASVIEGLASGVPACLSEIPPHLEIRNLNPACCEVFRPGDAGSLAAKLDAMISGVIDRASAARSVAVDHLDAGLMSQEYQRMFPGIAGRNLHTELSGRSSR